MSIDTERFRTDLEHRRTRVMAVIEHREHGGSLEEEIGELVSSSNDNHLADTATETYDRELDEGLGEDAERLLGEIEAALRRIDEGTYGRCVVCGRQIDEERLEAVPHATLCIDDKRKQERG
jgi:RNA polymerase-binding protein DksA